MSVPAAYGWLGSPGKDKIILAHMCRLAYKNSFFKLAVLSQGGPHWFPNCPVHFGMYNMQSSSHDVKAGDGHCQFNFWFFFKPIFECNGQRFWNIIKFNITVTVEITVEIPSLCLACIQANVIWLRRSLAILTLVLPSHSQHFGYLWLQMVVVDE